MAVKIYWNKAADHKLLPHIINFLKKQERGQEPVSLPRFLHNFWIKIFLLLHYILLIDHILLSGCLYFVRY